MKTAQDIKKDIEFYIAIRDKAQKERRFRTVEGAQWNIDRCMDKLRELEKSK